MKEDAFKMGDKFPYGGDVYILARTINPYNEGQFFFQLIGHNSGNRIEDAVIIHTKRVDSIIGISDGEMAKLLQGVPEIEEMITARIKGPEW